MLEGFDSSYAQGDYHPPSWASFGIVNASRANIGLSVGSHYHDQVDNLRAAGLHVGHYFFNGNVDPTACADYFADHLYDYRDGDTLWLDSESEGSTGTAAWDGSKGLAWVQRVIARTGAAASKVGVYCNASVIRLGGWEPVADLGCPLWIAAWGYDPDGDTSPWDTWQVWQDSTRDGVDHNLAKPELVTAAVAAVKIREDENMRYINCPERGSACVGETGFFQYTAAVYGDTMTESREAASKLFDGIDVSAREWDIMRQDALNRGAAARSGVSQIDQAAITTAIRSALKDAKVSVDEATVQSAVEAGLAATLKKIAAAA